jgi:hypothetical protein
MSSTTNKGTIMQYAASLGQSQQTSRISPAVAGISAAAIAAAITLTMMMSSPAPVAASDQAAVPTNQCQVTQRKLYVSTTTGNGTVRLREGSYLSPPIKLGTTPVPVVFAQQRPDKTLVESVVIMEGSASDVVITSDYNKVPRVFHVTGVLAFPVTWVPVKKC